MSTALIFGIIIIIEGIVCMKNEKYFVSKSAMEKIPPQYRKEYSFKTGAMIVAVGVFIIVMGYLNTNGILLGIQGLVCYIAVAAAIFAYGKYMHKKYSGK